MDVIIRTPALSMQADAYVIKNPYETKNSHTITKASDAADVLNLTSESEIEGVERIDKGMRFYVDKYQPARKDWIKAQ